MNAELTAVLIGLTVMAGLFFVRWLRSAPSKREVEAMAKDLAEKSGMISQPDPAPKGKPKWAKRWVHSTIVGKDCQNRKKRRKANAIRR